MKGKMTFYTEAAYLFGIALLAFGTALMERANFGMSMVVAPAYLVHLKISQFAPFFTFGMAEYCLQALLLVILAIAIRKFKPLFLFSFVTAVIYGLVLDQLMNLVAVMPFSGMIGHIIYYLAGMIICSIGVAFLFHTYIAPEAYELMVKEISAKYHFKISRTKTVYDCCSCLIAVILSFIFFGFGHFEGVKWGTILCALVNGWIIGQCSKGMEGIFDFKDGLELRKWFDM